MSELVRRLRRLAPGVIGLGFAVVILWRGGEALEREARSSEREVFSLRVAAPAAVLDSATNDELRWTGLITPIDARERVQMRVDGAPVEARGQGQEMIVALEDLREQPGWHFVELTLARRGGRDERIVDPVLIARFAADQDQAEDQGQKPCAAVLSASPALLRSLVVPLLERELLPALRDNEHMGPETKLGEVSLALRDDGVEFALELEGINTLAVAGAVALRVVDERRLDAKLAILTEVDFRGRLRDQARGIGAGGGALVAGLIAGPLAPVGAAAGWFAADEFVTRKAREVVREQIEAGLEQLEQVELLPTHVELVPGRGSSRVKIGFCEQTRVRADGLSAGLWIVPEPAGDVPRFELGVAGPLWTGASTTTEPLELGEDVRVELSIDAVNALLTEWTASGLLAALIGEQRALDHANAELEAWTPLRLAGLRPTRPPVLTPIAGPSDGWRYGIGGLALELTGVDEQPWGDVYVAASGSLSPSWDPEAGSLSLAGSVDRLEITCAKPGEPPRALHGCFSEVLEAVDVRSRLDARLRPGAAVLPSLALRELLAEKIGVELEALTLSRPRPGVLRLSASVRGAQSE